MQQQEVKAARQLSRLNCGLQIVRLRDTAIVQIGDARLLSRLLLLLSLRIIDARELLMQIHLSSFMQCS
jgi:hypothetical protein